MSPRKAIALTKNIIGDVIPATPSKQPSKHRFPNFYSCYLLKSMKTTDARAQHNGEVAMGAKKTKNGRPWAMQMLVHGFPSRQAALQFEWAWQNPQKSRYLRDERGNQLFTRNSKAVSKVMQ
ncbi:structure-specific endonuclease catalytic subunit [Coprinopsis cinerea okayama7|uniref:Structure-specific endonuclease catalytic subunit n=1 Tax=Coprinopsis cinerea (strain Okayama-7 / 130 / ATCC MYA-4618 / FGSC 9003) TaxID=240176 RepID=D6RLN5_COPC7|nr:structure-specific endonuclease catalytic subunit [Coprinopsis cinerea okayama7\|eukprot:XP_002911673.1 structure-specific endonuclease catalytic subunit [Coprinopsis cinerea okayama7\